MGRARTLSARERRWLQSSSAFATFWPAGAPGPVVVPWAGALATRAETERLFKRAGQVGSIAVPSDDDPRIERVTTEESAGGCLIVGLAAAALLAWGLWKLADAIPDDDDDEKDDDDGAGETKGDGDDGTTTEGEGGDDGYWDPDGIGGGRKPVWM